MAREDLPAAEMAQDESDFLNDEMAEAGSGTDSEACHLPHNHRSEQQDPADRPATPLRYPSAYRDLAAALSIPEYDIPEYATPASEAPRNHNLRQDPTLIDPFADEFAEETDQDTLGLRGLQWLRRNVSSLRVTVSLQRKPSARKPYR